MAVISYDLAEFKKICVENKLLLTAGSRTTRICIICLLNLSQSFIIAVLHDMNFSISKKKYLSFWLSQHVSLIFPGHEMRVVWGPSVYPLKNIVNYATHVPMSNELLITLTKKTCLAKLYFLKFWIVQRKIFLFDNIFLNWNIFF